MYSCESGIKQRGGRRRKQLVLIWLLILVTLNECLFAFCREVYAAGISTDEETGRTLFINPRSMTHQCL